MTKKTFKLKRKIPELISAEGYIKVRRAGVDRSIYLLEQRMKEIKNRNPEANKFLIDGKIADKRSYEAGFLEALAVLKEEWNHD